MKVIAAAALAAGLLVSGAANATVIFHEGFDGYNLAAASYGDTSSPGVSSTTGDSFTTAYSFRSGATNTGTNSMYDEGTWTIGTNPIAVHSLWIDKPSSNPFLMLNGATDDKSSPPAYISNPIAVAAGTYKYSYQLLNLCCNAAGPPGTPSLLQLWYYAPDASTATGYSLTPTNINTVLQPTGPASDGWQTVSGAFDIGQPGGLIELGLSDDSAIASGNDFGVDNINLSAVPEPASWALMLMGFGGLGAALRGQRRRQAVAA